ncbi:MAG: IclR family transcriptional regulator [Solirubrobacteraceae bacterium]
MRVQPAPGRSGSTLERGLGLLVVLAQRGEARADELADAVAIPVSTVYRYLRVLRAHDFVVERGGVYAAGPLLVGPSQPVLAYGRLVSIAGPIMERLTRLTQETVTLAVRIGVTHALCIHQTESPNLDRTAFRIGQQLPLHAGAGERVLLAFAPPEVLEMALVGDLERYTDNTPDRKQLERQIASTRHSWVTTSRSEYMPGALAVAIPVAVDGQVLCSLTVSGPGARCGAGWQAQAKPVLVNAGRALEHLLRESLSVHGPPLFGELDGTRHVSSPS